MAESEEANMRRKRPPQPLLGLEPSDPYSQGPALSDRAALIAWITRQEGRPICKVPVVMRYDGHAFVEARVGDTGRDRLRLQPDDTRLGIPADERVQALCPGAETCAVWLVGVFDLAGAPPTGPDPAIGFEIRDVEAVVPGGPDRGFIWTL